MLQLRSASDRICVVPHTHNCFGDRSYSAVYPRVWNALPSYLRQDINYKHFKKSLKGHSQCSDCRRRRRIVTIHVVVFVRLKSLLTCLLLQCKIPIYRSAFDIFWTCASLTHPDSCWRKTWPCRSQWPLWVAVGHRRPEVTKRRRRPTSTCEGLITAVLRVWHAADELVSTSCVRGAIIVWTVNQMFEVSCAHSGEHCYRSIRVNW